MSFENNHIKVKREQIINRLKGFIAVFAIASSIAFGIKGDSDNTADYELKSYIERSPNVLQPFNLIVYKIPENLIDTPKFPAQIDDLFDPEKSSTYIIYYDSLSEKHYYLPMEQMTHPTFGEHLYLRFQNSVFFNMEMLSRQLPIGSYERLSFDLLKEELFKRVLEYKPLSTGFSHLGTESCPFTESSFCFDKTSLEGYIVIVDPMYYNNHWNIYFDLLPDIAFFNYVETRYIADVYKHYSSVKGEEGK